MRDQKPTGVAFGAEFTPFPVMLEYGERDEWRGRWVLHNPTETTIDLQVTRTILDDDFDTTELRLTVEPGEWIELTTAECEGLDVAARIWCKSYTEWANPWPTSPRVKEFLRSDNSALERILHGATTTPNGDTP